MKKEKENQRKPKKLKLIVNIILFFIVIKLGFWIFDRVYFN